MQKCFIYIVAAACLNTFSLLAQIEQPNHYKSFGFKLGAMDIRGEAAASFNNLYFGGETKVEYSSSFPLKAQWHYFAELSYYFEILQPVLESAPETAFRANAQGLNILAGLRWYVGNEPEFLKIKYEQNGGLSILPWMAGAVGAGMVGATILEGSNVGYDLSQGLQLGYFGEGSAGVDFFFHKEYKLSVYMAGRYYIQDHLDALIGTGPSPDITIHLGMGFHYLF